MERTFLTTAVVALGLTALAPACDDNGSTTPGADDGGSVAMDGSAPTGDGGADGVDGASSGDCLTGEQADIVRAIAAHSWVREAFAAEDKSNEMPVTVECNISSVNHAQPIYSFVADGPVSGAAPDPACAIKTGLRGRLGTKDQSTTCPALPPDTYALCRSVKYTYSPPRPNTPPHAVVLMMQYLLSDGTAQGTANVLELELVDDRLYLHGDSGQKGWGVYSSNTGAFCPNGVSDPSP